MNSFSYALEQTHGSADLSDVSSRPVPAEVCSSSDSTILGHKMVLHRLVGHLLLNRTNVTALSFEANDKQSSSSLSISKPNYNETSIPFGQIIQNNLGDAQDDQQWHKAIHMDQLNCKSHEIIEKKNKKKTRVASWKVKIHDLEDTKIIVDVWNKGLNQTNKISHDNDPNQRGDIFELEDSEGGESESLLLAGNESKKEEIRLAANRYQKMVEGCRTIPSITGGHQPAETSSNLQRKNNLFCGFVGPDMFRSDTDEGKKMQENVVSEMIRIGKEIKQCIASKTPIPKEALDWDQVIQKQNTISGFGTNGIQLYVKCGFTITLLHDELLWSNAVNLMTSHSKGCSLWISFDAIDACQVFTIQEIHEMMENHNVFTLVKKLVQSGINISYVYQTPGMMVESPFGTGSMHIVISHGDYIEQLALNYLFSVEGARRCLWFWKNQPIVPYNSGSASRYVIPCLRMQSLGYDLGLQEEINEIEGQYQDMLKHENEETDNDELDGMKKRKKLNNNGPNKRMRIEKNPERWFSCSCCLKSMDIMTVNGECVNCYAFTSNE